MKKIISGFVVLCIGVLLNSVPVTATDTIQTGAAGSIPHLRESVVAPNRAKSRKNNDKTHSDPAKSRKKKNKTRSDVPYEIAKESFEAMEKLVPTARTELRQKIGADEIVFIKRFPYRANHYYTEYLNGAWLPGGVIFVLFLKD